MSCRLAGICEDAEVVIYLKRKSRTQEIFLSAEHADTGRECCLVCIDVPLDTRIEVIRRDGDTWIRWYDGRTPQEMYCDRVEMEGYDEEKEEEA